MHEAALASSELALWHGYFGGRAGPKIRASAVQVFVVTQVKVQSP